MALKDLKMDYRTNKDILERFALNSHLWSRFKGKRIFTLEQMYIAISADDGESCYEIKITTKKERIEESNSEKTVDPIKNEYLETLRSQINIIFPRTFYHGGALIINDDMKDYAISLVKKKQCKWNKE